MKGKNMDSVFDNCTKDELEFDVFFDEDDTLIDIVAGINEAGEWVTGNDFDYTTLVDENGNLVDGEATEVGDHPDKDYQKDGDASYSEKDAEGSKKEKLEIGGEVGYEKEVSGKEKSTDPIADMDDEKAREGKDKQQTALEAVDAEIEAFTEAKDPARKTISKKINSTIYSFIISHGNSDIKLSTGFIGGDNAKFLKGEGDVWKCGLCSKYATAAAANGYMTTKGTDTIDKALKIVNDNKDELIKELKDAIEYDCKVRCEEGRLGVINVVVSVKFDSVNESTDPIADTDDEKAREGKDSGVKDTEGVSTSVPGAAMESSDIDTQLESAIAELEAALAEATDEGPLKDNDEAERSGEEVPEGSVATESKKEAEEGAAKEKDEKCPDCGKLIGECKCGLSESSKLDTMAESIIGSILGGSDIDAVLSESTDPIADTDDEKAREGKDSGVKDTEGKGTEVVGAALDGKVKEDPIADTCDCGEREGSVKHDNSDVEGVSASVPGAAMESSDIDAQLESAIASLDEVLAEYAECDLDAQLESAIAGLEAALTEGKESNEEVETSESDPKVEAEEEKLAEGSEEPVEDSPEEGEAGTDEEVEEGINPAFSEDVKALNSYLEEVSKESNLSKEVNKASQDSTIPDSTEFDNVLSDDINKDGVSNDVCEGFTPKEGIVYPGWFSNLAEAKSEEEVVATSTEDDEATDDADIEMIANMDVNDKDPNLEYEYDDDELIDMAINDKDFN